MLSQVRSAFLVLLLVLCHSRCRAQSDRCNAELAALAQALPHLDIRTTNDGSPVFDTVSPVLVTKLFANRPGWARSQAAGSSLGSIADEYLGNSADAEDLYGRLLSVAAYAALIGNHSLEELASVGTVETFLTEITGISHPLTFTGTDVNSYRVSDMTGAQFTVADTGVVICNNRVIIVDGVVLPATTYYGLPLVSASQFNAALYRNSYSLAPAPAPTLANRAPAQAPAPLPLSQQLRGKLRF